MIHITITKKLKSIYKIHTLNISFTYAQYCWTHNLLEDLPADWNIKAKTIVMKRS
jgi:hypothetical protein